MDQQMRAYASCRLTPSERKAVEVAFLQSEHRHVSDWIRGAVLNRLGEDLGPEVLAILGLDLVQARRSET